MFVVKIIICSLIVGLSMIIGITKSKKYEIRERVLREAKLLFGSLQNEIRYMLKTLPDAIESIRHGMSDNFSYALGSISTDMLSQDGEISPKSVHHNISNVYSLTSYDSEVISNGISSLGKGDMDSQMNIISSVMEVLDNQILEARDDKIKNSKMYKTLGMAIGLVIATIFI